MVKFNLGAEKTNLGALEMSQIYAVCKYKQTKC